MPESTEKILRLACMILAGFLCLQVSKAFVKKDPFADLRIPQALKSDDPPVVMSVTTKTNTAAMGTNSSTPAITNASLSTNSLPGAPTNSTLAKGTNQPLATTNPVTAGKGSPIGRIGRIGPMGPMGPGGMRGGPGGITDLPQPVQAKIEKIVQSEILGAVPRPMPMALLGIAGPDVFLRAPNGQTGLLRVGEELGGVKLLKIGTNRILIEHENERKELTLFSGFGGESMLEKENKK